MIGSPPIGPLTQGSIFSCAVAEDYEGCPLHGMVITARCDVEHGKAPVINYVPVVPFDDWILRDGLRLISERVTKARQNDLRQVLEQAQFAPSVLEVQRPEAILAQLLGSGADPKVGKLRAKAEELFRKLAVAQGAYAATEPQRVSFLNGEPMESKRIVKELCMHAVPDAHYLPGPEPGVDTGCVVLLREIRHLPSSLAEAVSKGLDRPSFEAFCSNDARNAGRLSFEPMDFAWPTGVVQSPFIEHLMQRLTLLFSRIGVVDVSNEVVEGLKRWLGLSEQVLGFG